MVYGVNESEGSMQQRRSERAIANYDAKQSNLLDQVNHEEEEEVSL